MRLQHQVPGKVPEGSRGFRCSGSGGFPVQIPGEVPEGSGQVPDNSGADTW